MKNPKKALIKLFKKIKRVLGVSNSITIYTNDHLDLVNQAARICVKLPPLENFEDKLDYVEKVVKKGHDSTLEHTNVIMLLEIPELHYKDFIQLEDALKYLNYKIVFTKDSFNMLISGSIRGYKHVFKNVKHLESNFIIKTIKQELYNSTYSIYYTDLIKAGIMDEKYFKASEITTDEEVEFIYDKESDQLDIKPKAQKERVKEEYNTFNIISFDDIDKIYELVKDYGFTYDDLLDICTISVEFKNISRAISQQLVRHRNAISQESQRYVNYSDMKFIDPRQFKDNYKDKEFSLNINETTMDLDNYVNLMMDVYKQLLNQGMVREDARGYLPFNIETKLLMTFTFRHLILFLELRVQKSAQAEIRAIANELEEVFVDKVKDYIGKDIYIYALPKYILLETKYAEEQDKEENYSEDYGVIYEEIIEQEDKNSKK